MVQSLLDLLCSQLKNLLSQAGASHVSAGKDPEDTKQDSTAESEKKDFRGEGFYFYCFLYVCHPLYL